MSPVHFKLAKNSDPPVTRLATFPEHPSWTVLAARIASMFEIPVGSIALTYIDREEITIATNVELQEYYQMFHASPIRFTVRDTSAIRGGRDVPRPDPLFDFEEDDWQRVHSLTPHISPRVFTGPRSMSRESGAFVETVNSDEDVLYGEAGLEVPKETDSVSSIDSIVENDGPDKQPIHVFDFDGEPVKKPSLPLECTPDEVSYASSPPTVFRPPRSRSLSSSSHEGKTRRPLSGTRSSTPEEIMGVNQTGTQLLHDRDRCPTRSTVIVNHPDVAGHSPNIPKSPLPEQLHISVKSPSSRPSHHSQLPSPHPDIQSFHSATPPLINLSTPALQPVLLEVHPGDRESILINLSPVPPKSPALHPVEDAGGISPGPSTALKMKLSPEVTQVQEIPPDYASATVSPRTEVRVNVGTVGDPPLPTIPSEPGIETGNASPTTVASLTHDVAQLLNALTQAFAAHPELSEGLRNIVRNATRGVYWGQELAPEEPPRENSTQRAAEEAGRRVAEALAGVFRALGGAVGEDASSNVHQQRHDGVRVEAREGHPSVINIQVQPQSKAAQKAPALPGDQGSARRSRSPSASSRTASPNAAGRRSRSHSPPLPNPYARQQSSNRPHMTNPGSFHPPGVSIHRPGGVRQFIPLDGSDGMVNLGPMWYGSPDGVRYPPPPPPPPPSAHPMFAPGPYYGGPDGPWASPGGYWGNRNSAPRRSETMPARMMGGPGEFVGGFAPPRQMYPARPSPAGMGPGPGGSGVGMTGSGVGMTGSGVGMTGTGVTMSSIPPSSGIGMTATDIGTAGQPPQHLYPASAAPVQQTPAENARRDSQPPSYEPPADVKGNFSLRVLKDEVEEAKKLYREKKDEWRKQRDIHKLEREVKEKQRAERRAAGYEMRERQNAELEAMGFSPAKPDASELTTSPRQPVRHGTRKEQILSSTARLPHITESPLSKDSDLYAEPQSQPQPTPPPPPPPKRNEPIETSSPPRKASLSSSVVEKMKGVVMKSLDDMRIYSSDYPDLSALVDRQVLQYQQNEARLGHVLVQEHAEAIVRNVLDDLFVSPVVKNAVAGPSRTGGAGKA